MIKLELNEVILIHKSVSDLTIKGAEAPFVANVLNKMVVEAEKLQKLETQVINNPKK
jgi:hypothetical protein|tara:strand:- start:80 stop:250 length:171 start_codon:yes stop_codon:yes gene_type:complete